MLLAVALAITVLAGNWLYHVARKPAELFFPVSDVLYKTPRETWEAYAPLFRAHSTAVMTPTLLAALAQVEASGNPVARTYWRFRLALNPLDIYRPASSAVGMYQITDATFEQARRLCIHEHAVAREDDTGPRGGCWFNALYSRVIPSHAVEMTSAYLDDRVRALLARHRRSGADVASRRSLAVLVHLCGAGAGERFVRRGLRLAPGERCGDHDARRYLDKVARAESAFAVIAAQERARRPG